MMLYFSCAHKQSYRSPAWCTVHSHQTQKPIVSDGSATPFAPNGAMNESLLHLAPKRYYICAEMGKPKKN
ncbi:unnamed protein product [Ixodes pacificus]